MEGLLSTGPTPSGFYWKEKDYWMNQLLNDRAVCSNPSQKCLFNRKPPWAGKGGGTSCMVGTILDGTAPLMAVNWTVIKGAAPAILAIPVPPLYRDITLAGGTPSTGGHSCIVSELNGHKGSATTKFSYSSNSAFLATLAGATPISL